MDKIKILATTICCFLTALRSEAQCRGVAEINDEHDRHHQSLNLRAIEDDLTWQYFSSAAVTVDWDGFDLEDIQQAIINSIKDAEDQQKREINNFFIRELMIDDVINQYKALTNETLTYRELADASLKLNLLYKNRQKLNQERNKEDGKCDLVLTNWFLQEGGLKWGRVMTEPHALVTDPRDDGATVPCLRSCVKNIEEDISESLRLYEDLHGKPHPRSAEFRYLSSANQ